MQRRSTISLVVTMAALAGLVTPFGSMIGAEDRAALHPGEIEALRAALDSEVETTAWQRFEVADRLELRWESRLTRHRALAEVTVTIPGVDPQMVETLRRRNRQPLALWPAARQRLGQRADRKAFLIAQPTNLHVQFGRVGWQDDGVAGLVYFELRPRAGAESMRVVLRRVERSVDGWKVSPGRVVVDRGEFVRETGLEP